MYIHVYVLVKCFFFPPLRHQTVIKMKSDNRRAPHDMFLKTCFFSCTERGLTCTNIKEMNTFEKKIFIEKSDLFSPAS